MTGQTVSAAPHRSSSPDPQRNGGYVTLPAIAERNARYSPNGPCALFEDGTIWTWSDAAEAMHRGADVLRHRGVTRGERVLVMLDNGSTWLRAWSAVAQVGAVTVPVNTAFRGPVLERVCRRSGATRVITDLAGLERVADVCPDMEYVDPDDLSAGDPSPVALDPPLAPWDLNAIMFTSGTTGESKGVVTPWLQTYMGGWPIFGTGAGLRADDRWLIDLPLFHVGGQQALLASFSAGASVAIRGRFTSGSYWRTAKETGVTRSMIVASMLDMLIDQPPTAGDRHHSIRSMVVCPVAPGRMTGFMERFGINEVRTALGSTETGAPIFGLVEGEPKAGWVGRARAGIDVQVVDEHDVALPLGEVGQLLLRSDHAWEITPEYLDDPEASRTVWRHGWFHTGDAVRVEADGNIFWIDRMNDTIRRRGENVSSVEVEQVMLSHPGVGEAACVPVLDEMGDEEIKAWIVVAESGGLDLADLVRFLAGRLPYFMVPRYFEPVAALPKTVTMRVQKNRLKEMAPGPNAWDRVAAGLIVGRGGLRQSTQALDPIP